METLATNLSRLRDKHSLLKSQKAIADRAGIDQRTVGRILNKEHAATLTQVERLAGVFGVEPWQLLAPNCGTFLYTLSSDQRMVPVAAPIFDAPVARAVEEREKPQPELVAVPSPAPRAPARHPPTTQIISSGIKHGRPSKPRAIKTPGKGSKGGPP